MKTTGKKGIEKLIRSQRDFYLEGHTREIAFRLEMLKKLKASLFHFEKEIHDALKRDLNKSDFEIMTSEIGMVNLEINIMLKNLKKWIRKKSIPTNILNFPASTYTIREPYGVTLILGPWNFPLQLLFTPLAGAIAGGNCAVIKPSELSPHTSSVIARIIRETFPPEYISVVEGGVDVSVSLLENRFDKIFFTGSPRVGSIVMEKAARFLTPLTLELGGKNPCIIDRDCELETAVRRIVFGKGINAGQSCIAPDYILVHNDIRDEFYQLFRKTLKEFYNTEHTGETDGVHIINKNHFKRIVNYLKDGKIIAGGRSDSKKQIIDMTLLEITDPETSVMQEEIFGPIMAVLTFEKPEEIPAIVRRNPDSLALYIFSNNRKFIDFVIQRIPFGGGSVNDTIMHMINDHAPFGGRGASGTGRYHGKYTLEAFTHEKLIMHRSFLFDLRLKYPPFKSYFLTLLKKWYYR